MVKPSRAAAIEVLRTQCLDVDGVPFARPSTGGEVECHLLLAGLVRHDDVLGAQRHILSVRAADAFARAVRSNAHVVSRSPIDLLYPLRVLFPRAWIADELIHGR